MAKTNRAIYVLSPKITWKAFKHLQERFVMNDGPTPKNIDKILWKMLQGKQILCWFEPENPGDMRVGLELPKEQEIKVITGLKQRKPNDS